MKKLVGLALASLTVLLGVPSPQAQAATLFEIDFCISGADCSALSGGSVVNVLINDVPADDLELDVENSTNGDLDYLKFFYTGALPEETEFELLSFVADPAGSIGSDLTLKFEFVAKTDAGYEYNMNFGFPNPQADRFNPGESVIFTVGARRNIGTKQNPVYESLALDSSLFTFALAHIISLDCEEGDTDPNCGGSIKLIDEDPNDPNDPNDPIPEPTSLALVGMGLLGAGYARRRRK